MTPNLESSTVSSTSGSPQINNKPIAHIHVENIQANLNLARNKSADCKTMAVVKANAYGHGIDLVAPELQGMDAYAVARVEEGLALRNLGIDLPVFILQGFLGESELTLCLDHQLIPMIHSLDQWRLVNATGTRVKAWLKFDTGMHRLGLSRSELEMILDDPGGLSILGVSSHFANADDASHEENLQQLKLFQATTEGLACEKSMANSGAILGLGASHYDWVRPGIMLYGGSTSGSPDPRLKPGMTLTAPVLAVRSVAAEESIGYGSTWRAESATRIAVLGIGYADGYPRELPPGTPVLVSGKRCSIVGRVSMDMVMVEVPAQLEVHAGDRAVMWGDKLFIDDVATHIGTLGYTLMSGLTARVERRISLMSSEAIMNSGYKSRKTTREDNLGEK